MKAPVYVDYAPGRIAAWDPTTEALVVRRYEHVDHEEVQAAELAAIEPGPEVLAGGDGVILTDSLGSVRLIHGARPHPSSKQGPQLVEQVAAIRADLGGSVVGWIPRKANLADRALKRSATTPQMEKGPRRPSR